ncbi:HAMP domain-containing histidine kinase [Saccharothrix sp. S26]|uniref:sensor histidine kinase n=1 Tax=Saccharothrix sp. S26 TaxID=2907215 RepID=UPI001F166310|nr:HAMP domain-containing sensor histidine kinase [Saccharothrix sp. S26]MCE7000408.1 HAMP domain-containing histidine kinase [Saccharothrix sp. S26]
MRRSLRSRLVGLSSAVGVLAVGATAVLVTWGSRPAVDASSLSTDSDILAHLYTYANEHRDWDGVEALVRELAERTGRRIALAAPGGEPFVDSAALLRTGAAGLPPAPVATVDATRPPPGVGGAKPNVVVREPSLGVDVGFYVWQLTEQESRQRQEYVNSALDCVRRTAGERTRPHRQISERAGGAPADPCLPAELSAPSAATRALDERVVDLAVPCLTEHGLAFEVVTGSAGARALRPRQAVSPQWNECVDDARARAKRPHVAVPADLYLGESDRFDPFSPDGRWRTAAAVVAVLLVAVAVAVPAGRRLAHPIGVLTVAARRLADGDRATRVPVRGDDEVTRLATAFNTMADALARTDERRRALVGDVAHELRTPLANLRGHLEAVRDGVLAADPALVRSLLEEQELLEHLVADLHDLALADAGALRVHPEERQAADLAEQAVTAHRARAVASAVDLRVEAGDRPLLVHADPARLRQALGNLVSNAIRHTPPGGNVVVAVRAHPDAVEFTVTDTGSGIPAADLPHIFDRFYRAGATGGSGLGLAIAKHLVEAHSGTLTAESTQGTGSTFAIRLPKPPTAGPTCRPGAAVE